MRKQRIPRSIPQQSSIYSNSSKKQNLSIQSNPFENQFKLQSLNIQAIEPTQNNFYHQQEAKEYFQSKIWPDIFYAKKSIRQLLEERIKICQLYKLNFKKGNQNNSKQKKHQVTREQLIKSLFLIFEECPSIQQYDQVSFAIIQSSLQTFVFFSTDEKYIPHCKKCSYSIYIVIDQRKNTKQKINSKGNIICSNTKCKKHILGDFQIKQVLQSELNNSLISKTNKMKELFPKNKHLNEQFETKQLNHVSQQNKLQIKKAVTKIFK